MTHHTKHRPGARDETVSAPSLRTIDMSLSNGGTHHSVDQHSVSLGSHGPKDGRYVSLARSTFLHKAVKPCGEQEVAPLNVEAILEDRRHRALVNREKQFCLGPDEGLPKLQPQTSSSAAQNSPSRSSQSRQSNRTPSLPSPDESHKNATAMRECHVYTSLSDHDSWKQASASLMRTEIGRGCTNDHLGPSLDERNALRTSQRQTHFQLGTSTAPWSTEVRGQFGGVQSERAHLLGSSSGHSSLQIGMSSVDVKDTLKSLKQVDFRAPSLAVVKKVKEDRSNASGNMPAEKDNLVLGYTHLTPSTGGKSLYQASFTPIQYVSPVRQGRN